MLGSLDDSALASLMAEVDEPVLQRQVLRMAVAAAQGDRTLRTARRGSWKPLTTVGASSKGHEDSRVAAEAQTA